MCHTFLRRLGLLLVFLLLGPALAQSPDSFPTTLVDDLGRSVTIRRPPERIVSIAPSNTEILFSLGLGGRIVGVDRFSDFPPEAKQKPQVGGMVDPDFERIASLRPDLVFATGELQRQAVETSTRLGFLVFALNPSTVEGVLQSIAKVARITGVSRRGQAVITSLQQRVSEVTRRTRMIPPAQRPSVFWVVWPEPLMTAGRRTFIHDLIVLAGGQNIAADVRGPRDYPIFSLEEVASRNPDVIISTDEARAALGDLKVKEGWRQLLAVRCGRVYFLNSALVSRPGPRLVDGLEAVARLLQPSLFHR